MPDEQIEKITAEALKQTVWPGRMEVLADKPFYLLMAHTTAMVSWH